MCLSRLGFSLYVDIIDLLGKYLSLKWLHGPHSTPIVMFAAQSVRFKMTYTPLKI